MENYQEYAGSSTPTQWVTYQYDADNLTKLQWDRSNENAQQRTRYHYEGNGILSAMSADTRNAADVLAPNSAQVTLAYSYEKWDGYKESRVTIEARAPQADSWQPGTSRYEYDSNGHVKQVYDSQDERTIDYVNNQYGQVLKRYSIDDAGAVSGQGAGDDAGAGGCDGGCADRQHGVYGGQRDWLRDGRSGGQRRRSGRRHGARYAAAI